MCIGKFCEVWYIGRSPIAVQSERKPYLVERGDKAGSPPSLPPADVSSSLEQHYPQEYSYDQLRRNMAKVFEGSFTGQLELKSFE